MTTRMYLQHPERADLSWEILSYDKATNKAKLKGRYATIEIELDMPSLKAKGYQLMKGIDDAEQPGVQT